MIQNNLRTAQLAGFARQLGCKKKYINAGVKCAIWCNSCLGNCNSAPYGTTVVKVLIAYSVSNPLLTRRAVWRILCLPFTDQTHHMVHFTPMWLYFIITGFINFISSWDVRYGFIEDYHSYICRSKVSSNSRIAVARQFV